MQQAVGSTEDESSDSSDSSDSSSSSNDVGHRVTWYLDNHRVCRQGLQIALGISCRRLSRTRRVHHGFDLRRLQTSRRESPITDVLNTFFSHVYWGLAEFMPHDASNVQQNTLKIDVVEAVKALWEQARHMPIASDVSNLSRRYLPPGKAVDLYCLLMAQCHQANIPVPSSTTFKRAWRRWRRVLRFRKSSTHSVCSTCFELRHAISNSKSTFDRMQAQVLYLNHINEQQADREIYYGMRTILQDGWFTRRVLNGFQFVLVLMR